MPKLGVVLFSNVGAYRIQEMIQACAHMPYRVWAEPAGDGSFEVRCDKTVRLTGGGEGREASGDAGSAGRKPEAHAAQRRPGSNPGRSTVISLSKLFSG